MKILALILFFIMLFFTENASAQIGLPRDQQGRGATITNDAGKDLGTLVTNTITLFFAIGGIGFIIMILWGAVDWILSGGDKEKIAGARKRITTAIIGLILLSLAFTVMTVIGQIAGIESLKSGNFQIKGLLE